MKNGGTPRTCTPCRFAGGTIPLATGPGALGRLTFRVVSPEGVAPSTCRLEAGGSTAELRGQDGFTISDLADSGGLAPHGQVSRHRSSKPCRRAGPVRCPWKWSPRQDLHLQPAHSECAASAWLGYAGVKLVLPAGLSPATSAFEARRSMVGATEA